MYPMITSEDELDEIEKLIREVKKGLDEKNIPYKNIRTGIMIETPAAVMISEELGKRVDFLSLGTNDLTQYTLAMDRQNLLLKDKYNDHHPALVKMIRMVTEAGHKSGCEVTYAESWQQIPILPKLLSRWEWTAFPLFPPVYFLCEKRSVAPMRMRQTGRRKQ